MGVLGCEMGGWGGGGREVGGGGVGGRAWGVGVGWVGLFCCMLLLVVFVFVFACGLRFRSMLGFLLVLPWSVFFFFVLFYVCFLIACLLFLFFCVFVSGLAVLE